MANSKHMFIVRNLRIIFKNQIPESTLHLDDDFSITISNQLCFSIAMLALGKVFIALCSTHKRSSILISLLAKVLRNFGKAFSTIPQLALQATPFHLLVLHSKHDFLSLCLIKLSFK